MHHPFTIAETLKKAWSVIKNNFIILIVFTMITFFCNFAIKIIDDSLYYEGTYASIGIRLVIMLLEAYVTLAFYKLLLTLIDREYYEFSFKDIIPSFRMAINAVTIGIIVIVTIGTVLFLDSLIVAGEAVMKTIAWVEILAGIYLSIRLIFCLCFIVDDDSGPIESLKQSFEVTRNNFLKLLALLFIIIFLVAILLLIINMLITLFVTENSSSVDYLIELGAICWFAIAFPTVQVMIISTYRKLVYSHQDVDEEIAETN